MAVVRCQDCKKAPATLLTRADKDDIVKKVCEPCSVQYAKKGQVLVSI